MKTKQDYYLLNIKNWNTLSDVDKWWWIKKKRKHLKFFIAHL